MSDRHEGSGEVTLVETALAQAQSLPQGPRVRVKWYSDGSIRVVFEGTGPVWVDELHTEQQEPMIRVRPNRSKELLEGRIQG